VADPRIIQACDLMRAVMFDHLARGSELIEIAQES
jgi:hypothetical protein